MNEMDDLGTLLGVKSRYFSGQKARWFHLFTWLQAESFARCPQLELKLNERYVAFNVPEMCNPLFTVVRVDPRETRLDLGFRSKIDIEGVSGIKKWSRREDDVWVPLTTGDERVLDAIQSEYVLMCAGQGIPAEVRDGKVIHQPQDTGAALHKFTGMLGAEILRLKKASIRNAPLPEGSPTWSEVEAMTWEQIDEEAKANSPGFKTVRKLLTDGRFDR